MFAIHFSILKLRHMKSFLFNNRKLGLFAMLTAPFFLIDNVLVGYQYTNTSRLTGALDLVYVLGWLASLTGMANIQATGKSWTARLILVLQFVLVILAGIFCIYQVVHPSANTFWYHITDAAWPASNLFMLVTGGFVLKNSSRRGWQRWIVFIVGLWFPVSMSLILIFSRNMAVMLFASMYSAIAWTLMAYSIYLSGSIKASVELRKERPKTYAAKLS